MYHLSSYLPKDVLTESRDKRLSSYPKVGLVANKLKVRSGRST